MNIINFLLLTMIIILMVPVLTLFLQVLLATLPKIRHSSSMSTHELIVPTIAVIIPAHNESTGIINTLNSIAPQLKSQDYLLVVADNCTDDTANVVRDAFKDHATHWHSKLELVERTDQYLRGKGYALDFGIKHCQQSPPEIVVIIDADCLADINTIASLAAKCMLEKKPVQARYLMRSPENSNLKTQIAEFAMRVKNRLRPLGLNKLGLPCQLMGTGMAFLWADINKINLASGHIVEDLKMGLDLSKLGQHPIFYDEHEIYSYFPSANQGFVEQRSRWEHGHMHVILKDAPQVFLQSLLKLDYKLFALALDLIVPPLALLTILNTAVMVLAIIFYVLSNDAAPLLLAVITNTVLFSTIFLAWICVGKDILSLKQLLFLPLYLIQKIPLYIKFVFNRQVAWVRTKRDK